MNNFGFRQQLRGNLFSRCQKDQTIPISQSFFLKNNGNIHQELTVPHQDQIPMGSENYFDGNFHNNPKFHVCPDGTVIDIKNKRVVRGSQERTKIINYSQNYNQSWNDYDKNYFDPSNPIESSIGLSKEDIEYAKMSEIENNRLYQNMNPEQKKLMDEIDNGEFFPPSKLR